MRENVSVNNNAGLYINSGNDKCLHKSQNKITVNESELQVSQVNFLRFAFPMPRILLILCFGVSSLAFGRDAATTASTALAAAGEPQNIIKIKHSSCQPPSYSSGEGGGA